MKVQPNKGVSLLRGKICELTISFLQESGNKEAGEDPGRDVAGFK